MDSDFDYLLQVLHRHHKHVVVVSSRNHVARELVARADRFLDLTHLRPFVERVGKPPK